MPTVGITHDRFGAKMASISFKRGKVVVVDLSSFATVESLLREKRKGEIVVAVDEKKVLIKRVKTPSQKHSILRKTLPFQLETLFSLPQTGFFFHPFFSNKDATFVAAVAKREVEYLVSRFDPETITTEQNALLHFAHAFCPEKETLCICHVAKSGIKVLYIEKGSYSRSTTLPVAPSEHAASLLEQLMLKKKKVPFLFLGERELRDEFKKALKDLKEEVQEVSLSLPESHLEYALEIGVALEGAEQKSDSIQLRSEALLPSTARKKRWNVVNTTLLVLFGLAACAQYYFSNKYDTCEKRLLKEVTHVSEANPYLFKGVEKYTGYRAKLLAMKDRLLKVPAKKRYIDPPPRCVDALTCITTQFRKDGIRLLDFQYTLDSFPTIKRGRDSYLANVIIKIDETDPVQVKKTISALKKRVYFKDTEFTVRREEHGYLLSCTITS